MNKLSDATATGAVKLFDHLGEDDYRAAKWTADRPLDVPSVSQLVTQVRDGITDRSLLLPDEEALAQRLVLALLGGHLIIEGPPGTGKTTLAGVLAQAFGATFDVETATADWSTFDVIGGLQPAVGEHGTEILKPWIGHVPRAALRCADAIVRHDDDPSEHPDQAHWLVVDEFNRADIDKAVGPLYTVLGGGGDDQRRKLPLWFGDKPETQECWIPDRFRIIGTLNSVDTAYVYTLSQGLQRRFQFIYLGVPGPDQTSDEMTNAQGQAARWWVDTYEPQTEVATATSEIEKLASDSAIAAAMQRLRTLVDYLRYDEAISWPVGTAQVVDIAKQLVIRAASDADGTLDEALDFALADRLVPQMSGLLRSQLEAFGARLAEDFDDLQRTTRALARVRQSQQTSFA